MWCWMQNPWDVISERHMKAWNHFTGKILLVLPLTSSFLHFFLFTFSSICGDSFTAKFSAQVHEKSHVKNGSVVPHMNKKECPKCLVSFQSGSLRLLRHISRCNGNSQGKQRVHRYPCFQCRSKFGLKANAAEHMATKHNYVIENPEKMCFECKVEVEDIVMHARKHTCRFVCSKCGLRFISQEVLKKHLNDRHDNSSRPFTCDFCNISFKTINHLRSHMATRHTAAKDKKFVCEICDRRYPFKYQLNSHMNSAHSDVKRWILIRNVQMSSNFL